MKEMICIGCPKGCHLSIEEETLVVTGNGCPRGEAYARDELTNPTRTLTSSVVIDGSFVRRCPVKTAAPIPKGLVQEAAKALDGVRLTAPVKVGDVAVANILGTGVDVVVTRSLNKV